MSEQLPLDQFVARQLASGRYRSKAERVLRAALDPTIASRAKKGEFVQCFDHCDLLQTAIN